MGAISRRDEEGLTDLERRFAVLYLRDFNATQAYKDASPRKVSIATAMANGHKLLQLPRIRELVKAERDRLMSKADLSVESILEQLRRTLTFNPKDFFDAEGNLKPIAELESEPASALAGFEVTEETERDGKVKKVVGYTKKVRFINRLDAIEKAMRYQGLFERDNKQQSEALLKMLKEGINITLVKPNGP